MAGVNLDDIRLYEPPKRDNSKTQHHDFTNIMLPSYTPAHRLDLIQVDKLSPFADEQLQEGPLALTQFIDEYGAYDNLIPLDVRTDGTEQYSIFDQVQPSKPTRDVPWEPLSPDVEVLGHPIISHQSDLAEENAIMDMNSMFGTSFTSARAQDSAVKNTRVGQTPGEMYTDGDASSLSKDDGLSSVAPCVVARTSNMLIGDGSIVEDSDIDELNIDIGYPTLLTQLRTSEQSRNTVGGKPFKQRPRRFNAKSPIDTSFKVVPPQQSSPHPSRSPKARSHDRMLNRSCGQSQKRVIYRERAWLGDVLEERLMREHRRRSRKQYLVRWADSWVNRSCLPPDVVRDWDKQKVSVNSRLI